VVRRLVPAALDLQVFDGMAPTFPEINVRTYVVAGARPGVFFFSLDAGSTLAVLGACALYALPYFRARMDVRPVGDAIACTTRRTHRARLRAVAAGAAGALRLPPRRAGLAADGAPGPRG
jgi:uncharacterized protein YqjF (DUF2071 family)